MLSQGLKVVDPEPVVYHMVEVRQGIRIVKAEGGAVDKKRHKLKGFFERGNVLGKILLTSFRLGVRDLDKDSGSKTQYVSIDMWKKVIDFLNVNADTPLLELCERQILKKGATNFDLFSLINSSKETKEHSPSKR